MRLNVAGIETHGACEGVTPFSLMRPNAMLSGARLFAQVRVTAGLGVGFAKAGLRLVVGESRTKFLGARWIDVVPISRIHALPLSVEFR